MKRAAVDGVIGDYPHVEGRVYRTPSEAREAADRRLRETYGRFAPLNDPHKESYEKPKRRAGSLPPRTDDGGALGSLKTKAALQRWVLSSKK